jgi:hypothetical protein
VVRASPNGVPIRGRYLEIDPPRRVVVSWGVAGSTDLCLVHSGLPPSQAPMHATGWNHFLPRLSLAAAGTDPGPDPWNQASEPPRPGRGVDPGLR